MKTLFFPLRDNWTDIDFMKFVFFLSRSLIELIGEKRWMKKIESIFSNFFQILFQVNKKTVKWHHFSIFCKMATSQRVALFASRCPRQKTEACELGFEY